MGEKKVSVVMATYNGEDFIEEQLLSLYEQTRPADEVLISDDGSTDRTLDIITDFIERHQPENWIVIKDKVDLGDVPGIYKATNNFLRTAKKATGDIIFFSDQDDTWDPKKIEVMAGHMENDPQIYALLCNQSLIDAKGVTLCADSYKNVFIGFPANVPQKLDLFDPAAGATCLCCHGMCLAVRKNVIESFAECEERLGPIPLHDLLCVKIAAIQDRFYYLNQVLAHHRGHANNLCGANTEKNRNHAERATSIELVIQYCNEGLKLLDCLRPEDFAKKERFFLARRALHERRLRIFKERKLFSTLFLFPGISMANAYTTRNYLGDVVYLLHLEKLFK